MEENMVNYYDIYLSDNIFNEILSAIENAVDHTDKFDELYELIHLYDYIIDEMEESKDRHEKSTKRYLEQQRLFTEDKPDNVWRFHKIKSVLEDYPLDLDAETEFHLICDLSEGVKR